MTKSVIELLNAAAELIEQAGDTIKIESDADLHEARSMALTMSQISEDFKYAIYAAGSNYIAENGETTDFSSEDTGWNDEKTEYWSSSSLDC